MSKLNTETTTAMDCTHTHPEVQWGVSSKGRDVCFPKKLSMASYAEVLTVPPIHTYKVGHTNAGNHGYN